MQFFQIDRLLIQIDKIATFFVLKFDDICTHSFSIDKILYEKTQIQ